MGKKKCKVHTGERGGKFVMVRKRGGGSRRKYLSEDKKSGGRERSRSRGR